MQQGVLVSYRVQIFLGVPVSRRDQSPLGGTISRRVQIPRGGGGSSQSQSSDPSGVSVSNLYMVTAKNTVCITTLKKKLDPPLSEGLLFLHAISGCDTISTPHGIGKVIILKKYVVLKNSTTIFKSLCLSKEDIERAGEKALLDIYCSAKSQNLNAARVEKF